jgi:prevent-host-death family protein
VRTIRTGEPEPAARTVGIRELKTKASEIVREVRETGRPIDITVRGRVVARLTPSLDEPDRTVVAEGADRRHAIRDWLGKLDDVSREIAAVWPKDVSAQDVIDDVRGPW